MIIFRHNKEKELCTMLKTNKEIRQEKIHQLYETKFKKYNTIIGTVVGCNSKGCYVREIESGETVFYYGNGYRGDKVQLSVKYTDPKNERVLCQLDSVIEYGEIA